MPAADAAITHEGIGDRQIDAASLAGNDPAPAHESLDHLESYIRLLFGRPTEETLP